MMILKNNDFISENVNLCGIDLLVNKKNINQNGREHI